MTDSPKPSEIGPVPALSIVMPAYNAARFIERAIDSILAQTFADFELVIIDDASTDNTWQLINKHAATDPRVRPFRNERNLGAPSTINRGVKLARAALIGRMDADDVSLATRFQKQIDFLQTNPHFAVVGTYAAHTNEEDQVLSLSPTGPASEAEFQRLRTRGEATMVFGGTALFRKELFERVGGFDPAFTVAEDLELFDRMADHGPVVAIPEALLLYRLHHGSNVRLTFQEGRLIHRFTKARRQATRQQLEPMSLEQYRAWERQRPWWQRVVTWLQDRGQFHYREAGMAYGQGRKWRFATNLAIATFANPVFVARRLWTQRLAPSARSSADDN
jgi:glycosyltransferase involved in cell wall biosynthesis